MKGTRKVAGKTINDYFPTSTYIDREWMDYIIYGIHSSVFEDDVSYFLGFLQFGYFVSYEAVLDVFLVSLFLVEGFRL